MTEYSSSLKNRLRNLRQNQNLTDEEWDEKFTAMMIGAEPNRLWENRIKKKMEEYGESYDLDDLKPNDLATLRSLIQAVLRLEDYEQITNNLMVEGIDSENVGTIEKLNRMMGDLRTAVSNMQNDLKITRRIRKGDKEEGAIAFVESLKDKARRFYEAKMSYVFCPKCNNLLGTIWFHYPDAENKLVFRCQRKLDNGELCDTKVIVSSKDVSHRGSNKPEILPESMQ